MNKNYTRQEIDDFLDGIHPEPFQFENAMKNNPALADEVKLQRDIEKAFSDPRKNQLRDVLAELNSEFAAETAAHNNTLVVHFQKYTRQYMALAAVLVLAVFGVMLMDNTRGGDTGNNVADTEQPTPPQPETPITPQPETTNETQQEVANNDPLPSKNTPAPLPQQYQTNQPAQKSGVKVDVQYLPSELTRGSDGAAKIELVADLILKNGLEELEEVEVRLVPRSSGKSSFKEKMNLREEKAIGFVKNSPPAKLLEVETSAPLDPGEYDVQIILPDGEIIFSGRTIVN